MTELKPEDEIVNALREYERVGGVVEHVLISPNDGKQPHEEFHRAAALFTLSVLARRTDDYFARLLAQPEYRNRQRSEFFRITVDPDLLTGRAITVAEFLGPWWDVESSRFVRDTRVVYGEDMVGYAYAFRDPPYNLSCTEAEAAEVFRELTGALFGRLDAFGDPLSIYEWSTDCSNYFDAGREWWGTFFWTVEHRDSGRVVGIAGSQTD